MQFQLLVRTEIRNPEGKLIRKREFESKSFVSNFLNLLYQLFIAGATTTKTTAVGTVYLAPSVDTLTDVTGTAQNVLAGFDLDGGVTPAYPICTVDAPSANDSYGIVVGTGTTAVSANDYNLVSKIPHGTEDGQLSYDLTEVLNYSVADPDVTFDVRRIFTNHAASIDVWELGIIAQINLANASNAYFLLVRDVLPSADTVPSLYNYTVTYTFKTTA